jgi:hypothetical protein
MGVPAQRRPGTDTTSGLGTLVAKAMDPANAWPHGAVVLGQNGGEP